MEENSRMTWCVTIGLIGVAVSMCSQSENSDNKGDSGVNEGDVTAKDDADSDSDADSDVESTQESSEFESDDETNDDSDLEPDSNDSAKSDLESDSDDNTESNSDAEPDSDADDTGSDMESDSDDNTESNSDAESESDADDTGSDMESDSGSDDTNGDTEEDSDTDTVGATDSDTDSDTDTDDDADTNATDNADTDTGSGSGTDTDADTGESTDSGNDTGSGSSGCGAANSLQSGTFTIDVEGTERTYILDVPSSYDTNHLYRLVFAWHWLGGNATDVESQGYYGLKDLSNDTAIFVSPDGLMGSAAGIDGKGWYNTNGGDIKFLRAMLDHFNENLCIDQDRIFSTGFSFGGMMTNAIGCEMPEVFRALAPMAGNLQGSGCNQASENPIAYFGIHGANDDFVSTESGRAARDVFLARNNCSDQTEPASPNVCVAYQGCDEGYPVFWCEWDGAHSPWPDAAEPIWTFFEQF